MKNAKIFYAGGVVIIIIVGVLSFWMGSKLINSDLSVEKNMISNGSAGFPQGIKLLGQNGPERGMLSGKVISIDDKNIVIESPNGGSTIILYSSETQFRKSIEGLASDVKEGEQLMISGKQNSDGSFTAQSVQIR